MTYRVVYKLLAEGDVAEAKAWYESQQSGLGNEFLREVEAITLTLADIPEAYPIVRKKIRRAALRIFPYNLFYTIIRNEVIVLAVIHGKRHPKVWRERAKDF